MIGIFLIMTDNIFSSTNIISILQMEMFSIIPNFSEMDESH